MIACYTQRIGTIAFTEQEQDNQTWKTVPIIETSLAWWDKTAPYWQA